MADLFRLRGATLRTDRVPRLGPLDLDLAPGLTALTGPSGSGKTSLLHLLAGFESATEGTVEHLPPTSPTRIPLFWAPSGDGLWPHLTATDHLRATGCADPAPLLATFGLAALADRKPHALSRGERNRLALARALASAAPVLLLDEPLAHVPRAQARQLWSALVAHARARGVSLIFATHDPALAATADRVIALEEGRLA